MDVIVSNRGKNKLAYNGFIYRKDKATQTTITWRCEVKGCKGRLLIEALRREESLQRTIYFGIVSGEPAQKRRK